jgi:hypothetical protein
MPWAIRFLGGLLGFESALPEAEVLNGLGFSSFWSGLAALGSTILLAGEFV